MKDLVLPPSTRPNYFTGEALLTDDFICEQAFQMGSLAAMNGTLHTCGIAAGLEVQWFKESQPGQVHVSAGMAIDRLGRQIVLDQPQLIVLDGIEAGATYYLTITYHEVYGGLTDESGVLGYKRVIQQPRISYERTLRDSGLNILLAVLTFTNQATIASLAYRAGRNQRRYVGGRFGALSLVTEGAGISTGAEESEAAATKVQLVARRETDGSANSFLDVQAPRSQFAGPLTTRMAIGIGLDHPTAALDLATVTAKGRGTFTTQGSLLTLSDAIIPPLQPGDIVTPDVSAALAPPQPSQVTIVEALPGGQDYRISQAFKPDMTTPTRFTYIRTTLVRIADPDKGDLLSIGSDGTLWLGIRAAAPPGSTALGQGVLAITPDRRVGIGLSGSAVPQAALQVAGSILTDQLVSNGAVKAQSFEGNGSKLTNLSFLSYWTKTNVGDNNSPIYYDQGNVGVQITHPPATLSAGTRAPFIGSGMISTDPKAADAVTGNQTLFTSEIALGDSITVGTLDQQRRTVVKVIDDLNLVIDTQFSVIVQKSAYQTVVGQGEPQDGAGTISSNGTAILGAGTSFTSLKEGDFLAIDAFMPVEGQKATRMVKEVISDTELTLQPLDAGQAWEANISAFMVSSGLMGYFQATQGQPLTDTLPVPALLVKYNGEDPNQVLATNTVAINVPLDQTDPAYALQVNGAVNFSGTSSFTNLTTDTLTVNKWAQINGDITVTGAVTGKSLQGDTVTGTSITGTTLSGTTVTGTTVSSTGAMTCGAQFSAQSLSVQGVTIGTDQSVTLFGNRVAYSDGNLDSSGNFAQVAATDGFVAVFLGTPSTDFTQQFASSLTVTTEFNAQTNSTVATAASTAAYSYSSGKKSATTIYIPTYGTLTVPVRKGEIWRLAKLNPPSAAGIAGANLVFYWVPLGPGGSAGLGAERLPQGTDPAVMSLLTSLQAQRAHITSGGTLGVAAVAPAPDTQANIDARAGDLTRIFGDATGMDAVPGARAAFQQDLMNIVCRADAVAQRVANASIQKLIDTFGTLTGHVFNPGQRKKLAAGVRALVEINETAENRQNLDLIRGNIGLFLGNIEAVLERPFDVDQRRLLTRALVRLVGDGARRLPEAPEPDGPVPQ